jgi:hypothetical protein
MEIGKGMGDVERVVQKKKGNKSRGRRKRE